MDGFLVIATANRIAVFMNNGTASDLFNNPTYYTFSSQSGDSVSGVVLGDFNGNGYQDIAVADFTGEAVDVFMNNGHGTFGSATVYPNPTLNYTSSIVAGDFTNNGITDLVVGYWGSTDIGLMVGNGNGTFQTATLINTTIDPSYLLAADFSQDGNLDLAIDSFNEYGSTEILPGNGNGTFGTPIPIGGVSYASEMALGDFTNNGLLDLAEVGDTSPGFLGIDPNTSADAAIASFSVSAPSIVTAGQSFTLTATAQNDLGDTLSGYTGTVDFSAADQLAGFPASAEFTASDDGVLQLPVTLTEAGSLTVNLQDSVVSSATGSTSLTVDPASISGSRSSVGFNTSMVVSGNPDAVTIVVMDAYGNAITGLASNDFSLGLLEGTSTGTFGSVAENGTSGTYTAPFTAVKAGTGSNLSLTIGNVPIDEEPSVEVTPGSVDSATSLVELSAPSVASGSSDTVTLQAVDAAGNDLTSGGATVVFALGTSGGGQGTFGPVTDNHNGTYTATFTGTLVGSNTITATINSDAVTTAAPSVTVTPGPIDPETSVVELSAPSVASGSSVTVTLQAVDANGNDLISGGATVAFALGTSSSGQGTFSPVTDNRNGTYTATFTGTLVGSNTITATINGLAVTTTAPAISVTVGPIDPATSFVELSAPSVASGSSDTVTLQAVDAAGNDLTSGGATVAFALGASSGDQGTFGSVTDNHNGTYTAAFTGTLVGSNTITATINGHAVTTTAPPVTVTPGPIDRATSFVELSASSVASGSAVTVTLQAVDADGNDLTSGGATVAFSLGSTSGGQGTFSSVTDNHNGTYTASFTGTLAGSNTVTATINGHAVTTAAPAISVTVGPIDPATSFIEVPEASIASGSSVTVTLQAVDADGNDLTSGGATVAFALGNSGGGQGMFSPVTDNHNGTYTAFFTGTLVGSNTITATINGHAVTTTAPAISVTIGPVDPATSFIELSAAGVASGSSDTVTLQAVDVFGNDLTTGGLHVAFALGSTTGGQGTISAATDNGKGTYTATIQGTIAGSNTITATIDGQAVTSTAPAITVTPGPIDVTHTLVSTFLPSVQLGGETTIVLQGEDASGNMETSGGVTNIAFKLENSTGGQGIISSVTDNHNGTYTATFIGTIDGLNTIEATIGGTQVTSTAAIDVTNAAVNVADSIVAASSGTVQSGSEVTVTLQAEFGKGEKETSGGLTVAFALGSGSGGQGTFGPVSYIGNGVYQATFTGTLAGSNKITATIDGIKVTSKAAPITVTPGLLSYANSLVTVSAPSVNAGGKITVSFQPRDDSGNKLNLKGLIVKFTLDGNSSIQGTFTTAVYNANGTYTATFTGALVGGSTVVTTVNSAIITSAPPVISVVPGTANAAKSTIAISEGTTQIVSGSSITLTLQAEDADGNLETTGGLKVAFKLTSAKGGQGTFSQVIDNKNGTYTVTFTGTIAGTNTIEATIAGAKVASTVAITVTPEA